MRPILALCCAAIVCAADLSSQAVADAQSPLFTISTYEPPVVPGRTYPVLLCFHGGENHTSPDSGAERGAVRRMREALERNQLGRDWVVMSLHCPGRGWYWDVRDSAVLERMRRFTTWMLETRPQIDPRPVFYYGYSNGAAASGRIVESQPTTFAAVMPWAGGPDAKFDRVDAASLPDFFVTADWHRQIIGHLANLRRRGVRTLYVQPDGTMHASLGREEWLLDEGIRWMAGLRAKAVPPNAADQTLLQRILARKAFAISAAEAVEVERIGGREVAEVLQRGLDSASPTLRAGSAQVAGRGNHPSLVPILARIALADKDRAVRSQAILALSTQARWRDLAALDGLIAILDAKASSAADRIQAMQAIDEALSPLKRCGLAVDYPNKPVNLEESAGLWALQRQADDKTLGPSSTAVATKSSKSPE